MLYAFFVSRERRAGGLQVNGWWALGTMENMKVHPLIVLLMLALSFAGGYATHSLTATDGASPVVEAQPPAPAAAVAAPSGDLTDDDASLGPVDAPITIVEFSDYECPFCKKFRDETLNLLLRNYEGQIRFVYRDFPLTSIHPRAQIAAEVAQCAGDQGQYWPMHDVLFADQDGWRSAANPFERFAQYASQLGLEIEPFLNCLKSGKFSEEVQSDLEAGIALGITGTPTFIINGKKVSGALPYAMFQSLLERELFALSR